MLLRLAIIIIVIIIVIYIINTIIIIFKWAILVLLCAITNNKPNESDTTISRTIYLQVVP